MKCISAIAILLLVPCALSTANAQDSWRTPEGKPVPETPSMRAINGLGVSLLVTDDNDWEAKWNTPSSTTPQFNSANQVKLGGKLTILTFVANPSPNPVSGELNVLSHIRVQRPDGSYSVDAPNLPCLRGPLQGPTTNTRLCEAIVGFRADPGDPAGNWKVQVIVTDSNRTTSVPVEATFTLLPE